MSPKNGSDNKIKWLKQSHLFTTEIVHYLLLVFIIIILMVEVASARTTIQVVDGGGNDSFNTDCGVVNCHKPKLFGR